MTDITEEVIVAVVDRVRDQVSDISNRIYFEPPQRTIFPYISYRFDINDVPMKTTQGQELIFTFSVFTQREGNNSAILSATRIAAKLYDALEKYNDMVLTAGEVVCCNWDGFQTAIPEEDGKTVQMVSRFKIFATNSI